MSSQSGLSSGQWRSSSSKQGMPIRSGTGPGMEKIVEVNANNRVEEMKVQVGVCNRRLEDMRRDLVEMRVGSSMSWGVEVLKEIELRKELEMLTKEVERDALN